MSGEASTSSQGLARPRGPVVCSATCHLTPGRPVTVSTTPSGARIFLQHQAPEGGSNPPQQQPANQRPPPSAAGATASASTVPMVFAAAPKPQARQLIPFDPEKEVKQFWPKQRERIEVLTNEQLREASKTQLLPLARIKKIMKIDDDVKSQMISAEAPILFAKACEMFIEELTLRAWVHTEDNKRKTLQKNDIAMAISKYEQFDFLIDIVPREETKPTTTKRHQPDIDAGSSGTETSSQLQYYISVPGAGGQTTLQAVTGGAGNVLGMGSSQQVQLQNGQIVQATPVGQPIQLQATPGQPMQLITGGDVVGGAGQPLQLYVLPPGAQIAESGEIQNTEDEMDDDEI